MDAAADLEEFHQERHVFLDGFRADPLLARDFTIGIAMRKRGQHGHLTLCHGQSEELVGWWKGLKWRCIL